MSTLVAALLEGENSACMVKVLMLCPIMSPAWQATSFFLGVEITSQVGDRIADRMLVRIQPYAF